MNIKIADKTKFQLSQYSARASGGLDMTGVIDEDILPKPMNKVLVRTELFVEKPEEKEQDIRSWSDLAVKVGIAIINPPVKE